MLKRNPEMFLKIVSSLLSNPNVVDIEKQTPRGVVKDIDKYALAIFKMMDYRDGTGDFDLPLTEELSEDCVK